MTEEEQERIKVMEELLARLRSSSRTPGRMHKVIDDLCKTGIFDRADGRPTDASEWLDGACLRLALGALPDAHRPALDALPERRPDTLKTCEAWVLVYDGTFRHGSVLRLHGHLGLASSNIVDGAAQQAVRNAISAIRLEARFDRTLCDRMEGLRFQCLQSPVVWTPTGPQSPRQPLPVEGGSLALSVALALASHLRGVPLDPTVAATATLPEAYGVLGHVINLQGKLDTLHVCRPGVTRVLVAKTQNLQGLRVPAGITLVPVHDVTEALREVQLSLSASPPSGALARISAPGDAPFPNLLNLDRFAQQGVLNGIVRSDERSYCYLSHGESDQGHEKLSDLSDQLLRKEYGSVDSSSIVWPLEGPDELRFASLARDVARIALRDEPLARKLSDYASPAALAELREKLARKPGDLHLRHRIVPPRASDQQLLDSYLSEVFDPTMRRQASARILLSFELVYERDPGRLRPLKRRSALQERHCALSLLTHLERNHAAWGLPELTSVSREDLERFALRYLKHLGDPIELAAQLYAQTDGRYDALVSRLLPLLADKRPS